MLPLPSLYKVFRPLPLIAAGAAVAAALTCTVGSPRPHRQLIPPPAEVDPKTDAVPVRMVAKEIVASDALAGRLTLGEAAALIGWLNDRDPPVDLAHFWIPTDLVAGPGGWTRDELVCLHTIFCIVSRCQVESPTREAEVRAALGSEFEAERACGRPVVLPVVPETEGRHLLTLAGRAWERCRAGGLPGYTRPDLRKYLEAVVGSRKG